MFTLPAEHRQLFREPFGVLYRDIRPLIPELRNHTICSVGDVVTYTLQKMSISPAIAVIDGHTMRSPCTQVVPLMGEHMRVKNPPGTLTDDLIEAIRYAVAHPPVTIFVDGEEDLAVIPLVIAAPVGAMVLYGQPHEGVVVRTVDADSKKMAQNLLRHFIQTE